MIQRFDLRHSTKFITALVAAPVLLGLTWALLAQAAPAQSPQVDGDPVWVSVLATPEVNLKPFFVGQVYRRAVGDLQRIAGHVRASALPALASQPGVVHISSSDPSPTPPPSGLSYPGEPVIASHKEPLDGAPAAPTGWYENDTQGVRETWNTLSVTGTGVTIAVLDSGVDFGNPALAGRYAVQPATLSGTQAYTGWPIAFDDRSLSAYLDRPDMPWPVNWGWYVNATHAITGSGQFTFTHLLSPTHVCTAPGTSLSDRYLLGYHPDGALDYAPVLVADEVVSGTYNAVYMDLDQDGTFETKMDKNSPVGTLDLTGDGVPDISAGMLYWIADGVNPPPGTEAVYGPGAPVPNAGTLLAFMIDSTSESGGGHGTMCAGTAVGYDANGDFVPNSNVASFYDPATYGPLVQGPAPGAKVIALGNVYAPDSSLDAWYLFTVLGYDGEPGTGDEPQIVTLSFGSGEIDNDTWDWESRYIAHLNLTYGADSPLFIQSAGNGGPGYGTLISPKAATGLIVGGSVQYGTYNAWGISETVSLPSRVNSGDVAPFSGRGPGADGTRSVDLVANGMLGTGAYPVNYFGDGTQAYVHWRGTSRSAPVVGGMAALAVQGFYQANGRFPSYEELRTLLINGARDLGYDPLVQGAGQANAFRSTQLALARYGVTVDPPLAVAGDFREDRYPSFAAGLARGQTQTLTFTVTNPSTVTIPIKMDAQHLVEMARYTATIDTSHDTITNYSSGAPDYALDLTTWVAAHPDADLMVVRMTESFEHFDTDPPTPPSPRNSWRLMVYNWWDDGDGTWWTDANSNGRVNWPGEIDGGDEWMRFSYSDFGTSSTSNYSNGTQQEVRIGQPYTRSIGAESGGVWAGAAHIVRSEGDNSTSLAFEVVFYHRVDWPEVTLSASTLSIAAGTRATFQATVTVPTDAAYGLYQGIIVITDTGRVDVDATYRAHRTIIPLTWQVWPTGDSFTLGGAPPTGTPYDNGRVGGGFGWQVKESGDWRFYGFDLQNPPQGSIILVHTVWEDYPTDIDTLILGPSPDEFSTANPDWFGPHGLERVGGTTRAGVAGAWQFSTTNDGTKDWAITPAQNGFYVLAQQAVLFGGHQDAVPFTTTVTLLTRTSCLPLVLRGE
ncbi:MAG: S8 family serine peptidase [Anaerolineae bacterium]